jgi:hypothetical protein
MRLRRILLAITVALSLAATGEIVLARSGGSGGSGGGGGSGHGGGHGGHGGHGGGHHGHGHSTVVVGGSVWYSPAYYPYYYAPAYIADVPPPVTYVEQGAPEEQDSGYWYYYCTEAQAYYPTVTICPSDWQRVAPAPSN